jgi:hypothetical protein
VTEQSHLRVVVPAESVEAPAVAHAEAPSEVPSEVHTPPSRAAPSRPSHVPRLALSPDEVAQALGCSRDFLDAHIAPELRWIRRGRRKFVAVKELERWLGESASRTLDAA